MAKQNLNKIEGVLTNLGVQLRSANLQASAFIQDATGKEYAYTIVRGRPGHLVGYDMHTGKVFADMEIQTAEGAIKMVSSSDHFLYVGASNGHVYRTKPGTNEMEDLGKALSDTEEIMDMVAGKDGEIFGGTYPTGKIFRYHPKDGFSDIAGRLVAEENYVKSIVYQHSTGKLFAGVGSHAHLIEVNPTTKSKKELLPKNYQDREFVYDLGIVEGVDGGDRLVAWVTGSSGRDILVYNLSSGSIEQVMKSFDAQSVLKAPNTNDIYFTGSGKLYRTDITKTDQEPILIASVNPSKQLRWGEDGLLHIITKYGEVKKYNRKTGQITTAKIKVSPQPYGIQTLVTGPDNKIWSSGYLEGGNAVYDPATGKSISYSGLGQAEGMVSHQNNIYFGIYPKARIYRYDVTKSWNISAKNPDFLGYIEGQDRPFATASLPDLDKLFFGTISGYGKLGGALAAYDVKTNKIETFTNLIPNQSVAALHYNGAGVVWGGTTVFGGLGAKPIEKESKVFMWDVRTKKIIKEFVPVKGAMAITSLVYGPKGEVWGFADGIIFVLDATTGKTLRTKTFFEIDRNPTHIWRVGFLQLHPNGLMYGAANGQFFSIDTKSMDIKVLKTGVGLLVMDKQGTLYTRDTENLWSYKPNN